MDCCSCSSLNSNQDMSPFFLEFAHFQCCREGLVAAGGRIRMFWFLRLRVSNVEPEINTSYLSARQRVRWIPEPGTNDFVFLGTDDQSRSECSAVRRYPSCFRIRSIKFEVMNITGARVAEGKTESTEVVTLGDGTRAPNGYFPDSVVPWIRFIRRRLSHNIGVMGVMAHISFPIPIQQRKKKQSENHGYEDAVPHCLPPKFVMDCL